MPRLIPLLVFFLSLAAFSEDLKTGTWHNDFHKVLQAAQQKPGLIYLHVAHNRPYLQREEEYLRNNLYSQKRWKEQTSDIYLVRINLQDTAKWSPDKRKVLDQITSSIRRKSYPLRLFIGPDSKLLGNCIQKAYYKESLLSEIENIILEHRNPSAVLADSLLVEQNITETIADIFSSDHSTTAQEKTQQISKVLDSIGKDPHVLTHINAAALFELFRYAEKNHSIELGNYMQKCQLAGTPLNNLVRYIRAQHQTFSSHQRLRIFHAANVGRIDSISEILLPSKGFISSELPESNTQWLKLLLQNGRHSLVEQSLKQGFDKLLDLQKQQIFPLLYDDFSHFNDRQKINLLKIFGQRSDARNYIIEQLTPAATQILQSNDFNARLEFLHLTKLIYDNLPTQEHQLLQVYRSLWQNEFLQAMKVKQQALKQKTADIRHNNKKSISLAGLKNTAPGSKAQAAMSTTDEKLLLFQLSLCEIFSNENIEKNIAALLKFSDIYPESCQAYALDGLKYWSVSMDPSSSYYTTRTTRTYSNIVSNLKSFKNCIELIKKHGLIVNSESSSAIFMNLVRKNEFIVNEMITIAFPLQNKSSRTAIPAVLQRCLSLYFDSFSQAQQGRARRSTIHTLEKQKAALIKTLESYLNLLDKIPATSDNIAAMASYRSNQSAFRLAHELCSPLQYRNEMLFSLELIRKQAEEQPKFQTFKTWFNILNGAANLVYSPTPPELNTQNACHQFRQALDNLPKKQRDSIQENLNEWSKEVFSKLNKHGRLSLLETSSQTLNDDNSNKVLLQYNKKATRLLSEVSLINELDPIKSNDGSFGLYLSLQFSKNILREAGSLNKYTENYVVNELTKTKVNYRRLFEIRLRQVLEKDFVIQGMNWQENTTGQAREGYINKPLVYLSIKPRQTSEVIPALTIAIEALELENLYTLPLKSQAVTLPLKSKSQKITLSQMLDVTDQETPQLILEFKSQGPLDNVLKNIKGLPQSAIISDDRSDYDFQSPLEKRQSLRRVTYRIGKKDLLSDFKFPLISGIKSNHFLNINGTQESVSDSISLRDEPSTKAATFVGTILVFLFISVIILMKKSVSSKVTEEPKIEKLAKPNSVSAVSTIAFLSALKEQKRIHQSDILSLNEDLNDINKLFSQDNPNSEFDFTDIIEKWFQHQLSN